jgi:hypothetical protein
VVFGGELGEIFGLFVARNAGIIRFGGRKSKSKKGIGRR